MSEVFEVVKVSRPYAGDNGLLDVIGHDGLPFSVVRAFTISLVPPGCWRANHAHKTCSQIFWSMRGSWQLWVERVPREQQVARLTEGGDAILVPPMRWLSLTSMTDSDVLLVLCSEPYLADSYIRDRIEWERMVSG